jgi:hypothetical protein
MPEYTELELSGGVPSKICVQCKEVFFKRTNYSKHPIKGKNRYLGWYDVEICGKCEKNLTR